MNDESHPDSVNNKLVDEIASKLAVLFERCAIDRATLIDALRRAPSAQVLLDATADGDTSPTDLAFMSYLLSAWRSSLDYVDDLGNPSPLQRDGQPLSFSTLFEQARRRFANSSKLSLSLDETLDRLVQAGPVVNTDQGYSMKQYSVSMRNPGTASSLGYLSLLDDFLGTTVQNATAGPDDPTLFQRRAFSLDFPRERLPLLTGLLNEKGMTMLQNIESMKEWCGQGQDKQVRPEKVERLNSTSGQEQEETEKATANEPASLTIQPYQSPGSTCEQG